ncbi:MAG: DUF427 domain-containing protein [Candidatus Lambdaproteobacteria bacterium]|nr:DUF427 domain-containing protein [Candidatus Lambdaproteobacteria bacterium]
MTRAIWNGTVLAESDQCILLEGHVYFPPEAVQRRYLRDSDTESVCPWKGRANYFTIDVDGRLNPDAAWYYANPRSAVHYLTHYVAFWRGVEIQP